MRNALALDRKQTVLVLGAIWGVLTSSPTAIQLLRYNCDATFLHGNSNEWLIDLYINCHTSSEIFTFQLFVYPSPPLVLPTCLSSAARAILVLPASFTSAASRTRCSSLFLLT